MKQIPDRIIIKIYISHHKLGLRRHCQITTILLLIKTPKGESAKERLPNQNGYPEYFHLEIKAKTISILMKSTQTCGQVDISLDMSLPKQP